MLLLYARILFSGFSKIVHSTFIQKNFKHTRRLVERQQYVGTNNFYKECTEDYEVQFLIAINWDVAFVVHILVGIVAAFMYKEYEVDSYVDSVVL